MTNDHVAVRSVGTRTHLKYNVFSLLGLFELHYSSVHQHVREHEHLWHNKVVSNWFPFG